MRRIMALMGVVLLLPSLQATAGVVQKADHYGYIDWGRGVVRASGTASVNPALSSDLQKMDAVENAKVTALRNLYRTMNEIYLNAETKVRGLILQDKLNGAALLRLVQQFTIIDTRFLSPSTVEVEVEIPLREKLTDFLLPVQMGRQTLTVPQYFCPTCGQPWPPGKPVPAGVSLLTHPPGEIPPAPGYTGLIVFARGLGATPALMPRLLDEHGHEIYGLARLPRELAVKSGVVGYASSLEEALHDSRAGSKPLIVHALRSAGQAKTDLIIDAAAALQVQRPDFANAVFRQGRVVFVIDQP